MAAAQLSVPRAPDIGASAQGTARHTGTRIAPTPAWNRKRGIKPSLAYVKPQELGIRDCRVKLASDKEKAPFSCFPALFFLVLLKKLNS